jgi:hypothetical protein
MPSKAKRVRVHKPKPRGKAKDKGSREATEARAEPKVPETTTEHAETTENNDDRGAV